MPLAIAPFQGRALVGVGKLLRIYDLGKKKLLRKCENKVRQGRLDTNIYTPYINILSSTCESHFLSKVLYRDDEYSWSENIDDEELVFKDLLKGANFDLTHDQWVDEQKHPDPGCNQAYIIKLLISE